MIIISLDGWLVLMALRAGPLKYNIDFGAWTNTGDIFFTADIIQRLRRDQLVAADDVAQIHLTEKGKNIAGNMLRGSAEC